MITNLPIEDAPRNRDGNGNPFFGWGFLVLEKKDCSVQPDPRCCFGKERGLPKFKIATLSADKQGSTKKPPEFSGGFCIADRCLDRCGVYQ